MDRLQFICILGILICVHLLSGYFFHTLFTSKMKSETYEIVIPLANMVWNFGSHWIWFTIVSVLLCTPILLLGKIVLGEAYRVSLRDVHVLYPVFMANQIAMTLTNTLYMYVKVGEMPNKNGWFALFLLIIVVILSPNSGKNVTPR